jgi:predicted glycoside hydrolase/deacetylase ChbG (UPF0249 family)
MKMIIRADDVGYTNVCNIGTFETIERGVVTSADIMLDSPGTEDALERLRAFPWISVGWHAHFWGSPVLDPKRVPSLVITEAGRVRFRKDLHRADDVVLEEALMECRAQIDRCVRILGKAPDTGGGGRAESSAFGIAIRQICDEYGIAHDFARRQSIVDGVSKFSEVSDRWASRNICVLDPGPAYHDLLTDSVVEVDRYDPAKYYIEDRAHLKDFADDDIVEQSWHPGYVDYFVYRLGDYGPSARNFILARVMDVEALCSDRLRNWIGQNRIELINFRDALYGTREYQNHLKSIGSELCISSLDKR